MSVRKPPSLSIMSFNEALENLGLKARPPTSEELADKARQEEASREAVRAARQEEEDFAASKEGQWQAAYNQSLADAGRGHYAPIEDLSLEQKRFVLADRSKATERALAKKLGIKLGEPLKIGGGSTTGRTEIRKATGAEERARLAGTAYTGDLFVPAPNTPDPVEDILRARPTIVAEAAAYPASVLGGIYDLAKQALDSNPNLSQKERLAMTVLASAAFIPVVGKAGATAKEVAEEAAKEAAKAGAKKTAKEGLKEGTEKVAREVAEILPEESLSVLREGDVESVRRTLEEMGVKETSTAPTQKIDELVEQGKEAPPTKKGVDDGPEQTTADGLGSYDVGDDAVARSRFVEGLRYTRENHKYGESVSDISEEFAQNPKNKLFMTPDGGAGVAVTPEGNIVAGWSRPDSSTKANSGLFGQAMRFARVADAYEINGVLPNAYRKYGMVPVARVPFNADYVKADWNYDLYGKPDVVLLVRDPGNVLNVKSGEYVSKVKDSVPVFDSWDDAVAHQNKLSDQVAQSVSVHTSPPHTSTFNEFLEGLYPGQTDVSQFKIDRARDLQLSYIQRALANGVSVPPRVLDDFPNALVTGKGASLYIASPKADLLEAAKGTGLRVFKSGDSPSDGSVLGIAKFFEDQHIARMKEMYPDDPSRWRVRDPISNVDDHNDMVNEMTLEVLYQLQEAGASGKEWYDEVMVRAFGLGAKAYPELAKSETQRVLLTALSAITSPGMKADQNFDMALELYGQLFPRLGGGSKEISGKIGRLTGYTPLKNIDERGVGTKISGEKGPNIRKNLLYLQDLIDKHGPDKAAEMLFTPETFQQMEKGKRTWGSAILDTDAQYTAQDKLAYLKKHGMLPHKKNPPKQSQIDKLIKQAENAPTMYSKGYKFAEISKERLMSGEVDLGAYAFGAKVGPFLTNLNGLKEKTADLWFSRLYNRHRGETILNGQVIDAPRSFEERATMKRIIDDIAKQTGLQDYQVQSALWFYEQKLARQMGARAESTAFDEGAERFLKRNNIPIED